MHCNTILTFSIECEKQFNGLRQRISVLLLGLVLGSNNNFGKVRETILR